MGRAEQALSRIRDSSLSIGPGRFLLREHLGSLNCLSISSQNKRIPRTKNGGAYGRIGTAVQGTIARPKGGGGLAIYSSKRPLGGMPSSKSVVRTRSRPLSSNRVPTTPKGRRRAPPVRSQLVSREGETKPEVPWEERTNRLHPGLMGGESRMRPALPNGRKRQ